MRCIITFLFVLPGVLHAQNKPTWHIGMNTGLIINQSNLVGDDSATVTYNSENINVWLGLKGWVEYKHLQLGIAIENGLINEAIDYTLQDYQDHVLVNTAVIHKRFRMVSPAVMPMAFVHYKLNMPRNIYIYGGPAVGVLMGHNEFEARNIATLAGGINAGISFSLGKHARFEIAHAWRTAKVNLKNDVHYTVPPDGNGNYILYRMPDFWLQFITNSIGIVANL